MNFFKIFFLLLFQLNLIACSSNLEIKKLSGGKYLIVNGDDLCLNDSTDKAIVQSFKEGILTSTSAFINFPGAVENLKKIHESHRDLPIGLHINITEGKPVSDWRKVKSLTDENGYFFDVDHFMNHVSDMSLDELKTEICAQVELFLTSGVPVDHLDYHHHMVALYTPFHAVVREVAMKYNLPVRNPVPISIYKYIKLNNSGGGSTAAMGKMILFGIKHPVKSFKMKKNIGPEAFIRQEAQLKAEGIPTPDWFIDNFYDNADYENFTSILDQLPDGVSEIMCHPGRKNELSILTDKRLKALIDSFHINLVNYQYLQHP